jgi:hypothetical protein
MDQKKQKVEDEELYIYNVTEHGYQRKYCIEGTFYSKDEAERFVKILIKNHIKDSETEESEDNWYQSYYYDNADTWTNEDYYIQIIKNKVDKKAEDAIYWDDKE